MSYDDLQKFIDDNREESIEFGTSDNAPSNEWIEKAEQCLGTALPPSYIWFLKNCGGGEIHGDEIFSIYEMPFDEVVGGDIVAQTLSERQSGFIAQNEIVICTTDYGEQFVMDASRQDENNEYPIIRKTGNERKDFASSFADFIVKFVDDAAVS